MSSIDERIAAAEPSVARPLRGLVDRLAADGHLAAPWAAGTPASDSGPDVRGVVFDSRAARPDSVFVAVPGAHVDGHDFVARAASAGAAAALVEHIVAGVAIPQIVVASSQRALASAAAWWYGDPSRELAVIGITGTDGKTTTSHLAVAALEHAGVPTGLVGTIDTKIGPDRDAHVAHATTPEAPQLQAALLAMVQAGDRAAVLETTSHGLALGRVDAIGYDAAIFTNLTHEHLEFHGTFEAYRAAKVSLFERLAASAANPPKSGLAWPRAAVVNLDDPSADHVVAAAEMAGAVVLGYGTDPRAAVRALDIEGTEQGLRVAYTSPSGAGTLELNLTGRFNAHNALAVVALGEAMGLDRTAIVAGLESVSRVPGRMDRIECGQPFEVVVDYAHSPASLEAVLGELVPAAAQRGGGVIVVFGSAGERDRAKRPLMGRIAGERCRLVIVTDEDPRGEDRVAILDEIAAGAESAGRRRGEDLWLIPDRAAAIAEAFERARPGDTVLLAGKGHEASIIGPDGERPWNEVEEARRALDARGFSG